MIIEDSGNNSKRRSGSKGIPQKNIKNFNGKPLISWTIETALQCPLISETIVSTESQEIADIAKCYGARVPFMRPSKSSKDSTPGIEPVLHAIQQLPEYDWVLVLQPTSPLRTTDDICGIINMIKDKKKRIQQYQFLKLLNIPTGLTL